MKEKFQEEILKGNTSYIYLYIYAYIGSTPTYGISIGQKHQSFITWQEWLYTGTHAYVCVYIIYMYQFMSENQEMCIHIPPVEPWEIYIYIFQMELWEWNSQGPSYKS